MKIPVLNFSLRLSIAPISVVMITCLLLWPHIIFAKAGDLPKHNQIPLFSAKTSGSAYTGNSGNNPYESLTTFPKDAVFIVDTGDDLDKYIFKKDVQDGKIRITLPVSRYFGEVDGNGRLSNLQRMIDRGIIEEEAKLLINVFDVDDDYQGSEVNPEKDLVVFNGKQLDDPLSSGNNIWSMRSYSIPVSEIRFPQMPANGNSVEPANNDIEILIDRANQADDIWATEIDWVALVINGINPIVLIHGHSGDPDTWANFTPFLVADNAPFYLPAVNETESVGCINDNARHVGEIVENVKAMYGVEKVNLVTHSRGGVDSRIYIRNGNGDNINSLVQLATPNHGAGSGALGTSCSADDLQRGHFRDRFNYQRIHIPVGGIFNDEERFLPLYTVEQNAVATLITIGDADWVVDTNSATFPWTPTCQGKQDVIEARCPDIIVNSRSVGGETTWPEITNVNRIAPGLGHGNIHNDQPTYNWVIEQIGNLTFNAAFSMRSSELTQTTSAAIEDVDTSLILSESYVINPGNTRTHTINMGDTEKAYFQITYPLLTQLDSTLSDSIGNFYSPIGEQQSGFGITRRYVIKNPTPGEWNFLVQSVSADSYFLEIWQFKSNIEYGAGTEKPTYSFGETATVFAYLKDGANAIPNVTVVAKIISVDGSESQTILYDDGTHDDQVANDGVYTNIYNPPAIGRYSYIISAAGNNIQRQINGEFSVITNNSVFTNNYTDNATDSDNDGFADILTIVAEVDIKIAGDYEIIGSLKEANDHFIQTVLVPLNSVNTGKQNIGLDFDGTLIHENGVDGLLKLTDLMLRFRIGSQFVFIDYRALAYETTIYSSDDFEQPLVVLTGNNGDQGVDTNTDSLFDLLRITLELEIIKPGSYQVIARLVASNGQEIEWVNKTISLIEGLNQVSLDFDGQKIRQSQTDGSYLLKDLLIIGQNTGAGTSISTVDAYITGAYSYTQFQSIPTDLEINAANITFSNDTPAIGENIQLTAVINNNGETTNESIIVQFYEGDPLGTGIQIGGNHIIAGLVENTSTTILQSWSSTTEGNKDIYVIVNPDRSIAEFDYSNNSASRVITVSDVVIPPPPPPLLSAADLNVMCKKSNRSKI